MWHTLKYWALIGQCYSRWWSCSWRTLCLTCPCLTETLWTRRSSPRAETSAARWAARAWCDPETRATYTLLQSETWRTFWSLLNCRRWKRRGKINILFSHFLLHIHKEKLSIRGFEAVIISKLSIKGWMFISQSSLYLMSGMKKWISISYSAQSSYFKHCLLLTGNCLG